MAWIRFWNVKMTKFWYVKTTWDNFLIILFCLGMYRFHFWWINVWREETKLKYYFFLYVCSSIYVNFFPYLRFLIFWSSIKFYHNIVHLFSHCCMKFLPRPSSLPSWRPWFWRGGFWASWKKKRKISVKIKSNLSFSSDFHLLSFMRPLGNRLIYRVLKSVISFLFRLLFKNTP